MGPVSRKEGVLLHTLNTLILSVNNLLWSYLIIVLLIGTGILFFSAHALRTNTLSGRNVPDHCRFCRYEDAGKSGFCFSGILCQHRFPRRCGKYCRHCHCRHSRRSRRCFLDVVYCSAGRVHRICRKHTGPNFIKCRGRTELPDFKEDLPIISGPAFILLCGLFFLQC